MISYKFYSSHKEWAEQSPELLLKLKVSIEKVTLSELKTQTALKVQNKLICNHNR